MHLLALLAVFAVAPTDTYTIVWVEGDDALASQPQPLTLATLGDRVYGLDTHGRLMAQARGGGSVEALAQNDVGGFLALYPDGDALILVDRRGFRHTRIAADGTRLGEAIHREAVLFGDGRRTVRLQAGSGLDDPAPRVTWNGDAGQSQVLGPGGGGLDVRVARAGDLLLVTAGGPDNAGFLLLDLRTGIRLGGQSAAAASPSVEGENSPFLTAHPDFGFTLGAAGDARTDHRLLTFDPSHPQGRVVWLQADHPVRLEACLRLDGDLWAAFDGTHWIRFRTVAAP